MFDRLEDLLIRYEEVMGELQEPGVADDPVRFRKLMKEQSDLAPIVEAYNEYKQCKQNIDDSLAMLEEESDEEMRELAKEELNDSRKRVEELEQELKILLLPKDPNVIRTLSLRFERVRAEMKRLFLQPKFIGCTFTTQTAADGKQR